MAHRFVSLRYHIVFSTKYRIDMISPQYEARVWAILREACESIDVKVFCIGGVDDHVHLAVGIPPTISVSTAIGKIKGRSSRSISTDIPVLADFEWQEGYSAFTLSDDHLKSVIAYIARQRAHHGSR